MTLTKEQIDLSKPIECVREGHGLIGMPVRHGNHLYGWVLYERTDTPISVVWGLDGNCAAGHTSIRNAPEVVVDYCNDYPASTGLWHRDLNECNQNVYEGRIAIIKRTRRIGADGQMIGLPTYEAVLLARAVAR